MATRKHQESPEDVQERVWRRLSTEGLEAAAEGLISVCRDPKATAQSKATAGRTIFEAAGMLSKNQERAPREIHEMSAAEIAEAIADLEARRVGYRAIPPDDDDDGVFV